MVTLYEDDIFGADGYHVAETVLHSSALTFRHTHDFYELFLVTEGQLIHLANGAETTLWVDTLCLVRPEDVHCYKKGDCKSAHFLNLAFSAPLFRQAVELYGQYGELGNARTVRLPPGLSQALRGKLTFLAKDSTGLFHLPKKAVLMGAVLDGLSFLQEQTYDESLVPQWLTEACAAMSREENYLQGLQRFVALSGKSQEHLTRTMGKHFHITPSAYLNGIKLDQAAHLLKTTERTVLDVLLKSGFNNVSYFNDLFKREYGVTPTRYRRLNRTVISPG